MSAPRAKHGIAPENDIELKEKNLYSNKAEKILNKINTKHTDKTNLRKEIENKI